MHTCTPEDLLKFYTPSKKSEFKVKTLTEKKALKCLDDVDMEGKKINKKIFGSTDSQPNRTLVIIMKPCIPE